MVTEQRHFPTPENSPQDNMESLRQNPYPGRGIVMGFDETGNNAIQVYWVMGRSENSRNRLLVEDGQTVKTVPFDALKVKDPSLIIYNAMIEVNGVHIVSNGDQTDTIGSAYREGKSPIKAIGTRVYEPDAPNFTPRISGIYDPNTPRSFMFSKIRRANAENAQPIHTFDYPILRTTPGIGACFHTYEGDGNPLPAFRGEPYSTLLSGSLDAIAQTYWGLLNADNRVSLAAKSINIKTGTTSVAIINQLG